MDVDRPLKAIVRVAENPVDQFEPGKGPVGLGDQGREQAEFGPGQMDVGTGPGHGEGARIDRQIAYGKRGMLAVLRPGGAAQDRLNPGGEFPWAERLGEVVVGAAFEPEQGVRFGGAGGEHDDRDLALVFVRRMWQTSRPSIFGSIRSSTIRSGETSRTAARAASPSAAEWTRNPSRSSLSRTISTVRESSSTTRIVRRDIAPTLIDLGGIETLGDRLPGRAYVAEPRYRPLMAVKIL